MSSFNVSAALRMARKTWQFYTTEAQKMRRWETGTDLHPIHPSYLWCTYHTPVMYVYIYIFIYTFTHVYKYIYIYICFHMFEDSFHLRERKKSSRISDLGPPVSSVSHWCQRRCRPWKFVLALRNGPWKDHLSGGQMDGSVPLRYV